MFSCKRDMSIRSRPCRKSPRRPSLKISQSIARAFWRPSPWR
jgi:hypothetical protein